MPQNFLRCFFIGGGGGGGDWGERQGCGAGPVITPPRWAVSAAELTELAIGVIGREAGVGVGSVINTHTHTLIGR